MVGVGQHGLGSQFGHGLRRHGFDGGLRGDGHEGGRGDVSVGGVDGAGPSEGPAGSPAYAAGAHRLFESDSEGERHRPSPPSARPRPPVASAPT